MDSDAGTGSEGLASSREPADGEIWLRRAEMLREPQELRRERDELQRECAALREERNFLRRDVEDALLRLGQAREAARVLRRRVRLGKAAAKAARKGHAALRRRNALLGRERRKLRERLRDAVRETRRLKGRLAAIRSSTTWRMGAPLRFLGRLARRLLRRPGGN